jgi:hypothetical protein
MGTNLKHVFRRLPRSPLFTAMTLLTFGNWDRPDYRYF